MIICPVCKAENADVVAVCPYCDTSLLSEEKSGGGNVSARTVVTGPTVEDTVTTPSHDPQLQSGSGATSGSELKSELAAVTAGSERVVERLVDHTPLDPGQVPTPPGRGLLMLVGALGVLIVGGGSGFAGFRMGVNHGGSPAEIKVMQDLKAQLQTQQGVSANLDATVKTLSRQLAEKQTEIDAVNKSSSAASAEVNKMRASAQSAEQRAQKAQNDATGLRNQLMAERQRPKIGMIEWNGDLGKKDDARLTVEIQNGKASIGSLHGSLPPATCGVLSGNPSAAVTAPPSQASPNRFSFQVKGKGRTTVRLLWSAC
jgi:hypothetical protein